VEKQIAAFIRDVMNKAVVPSNDQYQQNLGAAKKWLEAIMCGTLVVAPPLVTPAAAKAKEVILTDGTGTEEA